MGNGHPISAVVTTSEIAAKFVEAEGLESLEEVNKMGLLRWHLGPSENLGMNWGNLPDCRVGSGRGERGGRGGEEEGGEGGEGKRREGREGRGRGGRGGGRGRGERGRGGRGGRRKEGGKGKWGGGESKENITKVGGLGTHCKNTHEVA